VMGTGVGQGWGSNGKPPPPLRALGAPSPALRRACQAQLLLAGLGYGLRITPRAPCCGRWALSACTRPERITKRTGLLWGRCRQHQRAARLGHANGLSALAGEEEGGAGLVVGELVVSGLCRCRSAAGQRRPVSQLAGPAGTRVVPRVVR
jgi:hypothetical protein